MFGFPHQRSFDASLLPAYAKANALATNHHEDLVEAELTAATIITVTFTIVDDSGAFSKESIIASLKHPDFAKTLNEKIASEPTISSFLVTSTEEPASESLGKVYTDTTSCLYHVI